MKDRHERLRAYAAVKPGAVEDHPWEDDLVYKVGGKVLAFFGVLDREPSSIMASCANVESVGRAWPVE